LLGPRAVALATEPNKELGLSPRKTAKALARFGVRITAGGVVQAIARRARCLEATYEALIQGVRSSRAVAPDEIGRRINGLKAWLWAFAGEHVTVYLIAQGRGYEQAAEILGGDFPGLLEQDGWAVSTDHRRPPPNLPCASAAPDRQADRLLVISSSGSTFCWRAVRIAFIVTC
jgi:hypothetical protein